MYDFHQLQINNPTSLLTQLSQLQDKNLPTALWSTFILEHLITHNLTCNKSDDDDIVISAEEQIYYLRGKISV